MVWSITKGCAAFRSLHLTDAATASQRMTALGTVESDSETLASRRGMLGGAALGIFVSSHYVVAPGLSANRKQSEPATLSGSPQLLKHPDYTHCPDCERRQIATTETL